MRNRGDDTGPARLTRHPAFDRLDHRPWPPPDRPWAWRQTWHDLLFAHWPIAAHHVRSLVPPALDIDEHEGTTWIGVIPFWMSGVTRRPLPALPGVSRFAELNVRLYVRHRDRPGVWFLSLDAASRLAVWAARRLYHLPYYFATMTFDRRGDTVRYRSERRDDRATFVGTYRPMGEPVASAPGSLAHWLTERYRLYAVNHAGQLRYTEIHHAPWMLHPAELEIERHDMLAPFGLTVSGAPAHLHFSRKLDVVVWPLQRMNDATNS